MNRWPVFIIFCLAIFVSTGISHAAGILMRVGQMKSQRQNPCQGMTQEQCQQYQEYQEQQQGDQGAGAPAQPTQPTYQQTVDERNQAIAQAILNAHNQSVSSNNVAVAQAPQQISGPQMAQQQSLPSPDSTQVQDVVDLTDVWKKLDQKSTVWPLLIDDQAKLLTVSEYIGRFQKEGVKINEPPMHYVQMIDQISGANPQMLQQPFGQLIQILAIVDYDFDNGMDKDELAKKVLGEAGFEANKKRFTQQQQPQQ